MALADRIFGRSRAGTATNKPQGLLSRRQRALKRAFDAAVASATLVVVSPLIIVTAILVRATSHGPAFYRHRRVGRHGRMFNVYKFRTMYVTDVEAGWQITVGGDKRITPLGRWLRSTKIDEVPQLWNVLRGEMSLVGWRPHVAGYPDKLTGSDAALIGERPGITGAATLYFRDEEPLLARQPDPRRYYDEVIYPAKVRMDLAYFRGWSLLRDIHCLLVTSLPFTDRWVHIVPTETLPEQVAEPVPAPDRGEPVTVEGGRPVVAVPVHSNGNGSRATVHATDGRRVVAVPVRSNGTSATEPSLLEEPLVIRSPAVIRAADQHVDSDAEDVASPANRDR